MTANVHRIVNLPRENARERALYASNTPPSQPDGRDVGGLTRRMRRAGRSSPKQHHNMIRRRVLTSSCGRISHRRVLHFQCGRDQLPSASL